MVLVSVSRSSPTNRRAEFNFHRIMETVLPSLSFLSFILIASSAMADAGADSKLDSSGDLKGERKPSSGKMFSQQNIRRYTFITS